MQTMMGAARRAGIAALGVGLTLAAAAPANAAGVAANSAGCTAQPAFDHPFTRWGDFGTYTLNPGGNFETGAAGWTLSGGAAVVSGDDGLGVARGSRLLSLPAGAGAVSAPICIDESYPWARMLARSTVASGSTLKVEVLYIDVMGKAVSKGSTSFKAVNGAWAPTSPLTINAKLAGAAPITFKFTAPAGSGWQLDDFFVDPRARG